MVSDFLTLNRTKASQLELEGGAIISKIMQKKECKIEFEHVHTRTKIDNDESGHGHEKILALDCDNIATEVRLKCTNYVTNDNVKFRGNMSLKHKDITIVNLVRQLRRKIA